MTPDSLEAYQLRVLNERSSLADKLTGLNDFLVGPIIHTIDEDEQKRLFKQAKVMKEYLDILDERIKHFDKVTLFQKMRLSMEDKIALMKELQTI